MSQTGTNDPASGDSAGDDGSEGVWDVSAFISQEHSCQKRRARSADRKRDVSVPADSDGVTDTLLALDRDPVLADHTVLVRDGRIAHVGPRTSTVVPGSARRIDGRNKWLMPGLVDGHVHAAGLLCERPRSGL